MNIPATVVTDFEMVLSSQLPPTFWQCQHNHSLIFGHNFVPAFTRQDKTEEELLAYVHLHHLSEPRAIWVVQKKRLVLSSEHKIRLFA